MSKTAPNLLATSSESDAATGWLPRLAQSLAHAIDPSEVFRDGRLAAPTLRPLVFSLIGLLIAALVASTGIYLCYRQLCALLEEKLQTSDQILTTALASIEREVSALPLNASDCSAQAQRDLTRAAIDSVLVSQFYIQSSSDHGSVVCGSLGNANAFWQFDLNKPGLQIVPSQSIRSHIVVGKVNNQSVAIAIVNPRQLIDRLPGNSLGANSGSTMINLINSDGLILATNRDQGHANSWLLSLLAPISSTQSIAKWPLKVEGTVSQQEIMGAISAQVAFWLLSAVLATLLVSFGVNRRLQKYSSRAWRLQHALKKRRFAPVVQPIVNASDGRCVGMEILMRWKHPTRGLVAPAEFIDYAERSGMIVPMSDLLMRQAHRQLADIAIANPGLYFSFNITPSQLRTANFAQTLLDIFDSDPISPAQVVLELTERDLVDQHVRDELGRLRAFGFKIAIDDFGTGQSSLAVLQDLVIDKLKIDRAFVNTVSGDASAQPVLDAIIDLAHRLKIEIVAEGIETPLQQQYLVSKGVQALQGYHFARPLTPIDFATWLGVQKTGQVNSAQINDSISQVLLDIQQARSDLEKNRWHYGKLHRQCILGNEIVSWLAQRYDLRRQEAVKLGQRLLAKGFLVHVFEEHDLEDAPLFYRLLSTQAVHEARNLANNSGVTLNQITSWLQGPLGVKPGHRQSALLRFSQAVKGSEVVKALMAAGNLDHAQAMAAGVQLMRAGLLKHAFDEQGFIDSNAQFYYLTLQ
jgi:sensor c-di-GMP phosphodiesterase-like protein